MELQKLENKTNKKEIVTNATKKLTVNNQNLSDVILNDNMNNILLVSDLHTIFNTISTNKSVYNIINDNFWNTKMNQYDIPYSKEATKLINLSRERALQILKIAKMYNRYKGTLEINLWFDNQLKIPIYYTKFFEPKARANRIGVTKIKNVWKIFIDEDDYINDITEDDIVEWLIISLYSYYNNYLVRDIIDHDYNNMVYEHLIKNTKKNKVIERAYLMAYELMMQIC